MSIITKNAKIEAALPQSEMLLKNRRFVEAYWSSFGLGNRAAAEDHYRIDDFVKGKLRSLVWRNNDSIIKKGAIPLVPTEPVGPARLGAFPLLQVVENRPEPAQVDPDLRIDSESIPFAVIIDQNETESAAETGAAAIPTRPFLKEKTVRIGDDQTVHPGPA